MSRFFYSGWIAIAFLLSAYAPSSEQAVISYIEQYKGLAISEMKRTGIPASITLAQGIVESRFGTSSLATDANNHFGIKCKNTWPGNTYYIEDDDYDDNNRLLKSCFRNYSSAEESYRDHSDFLVENQRYAPLFDLHPMDYSAWAKGLKRCGYATAPHYAQTLIKTIKKYHLYEYDYESLPLTTEAAMMNVPDRVAIPPVAVQQMATPPSPTRIPDHYRPGDGFRAQRVQVQQSEQFRDLVYGGSSTYLSTFSDTNR